MRTIVLILTLFLSSIVIRANAQVKPIDFSQLEKRFNNSDTVYIVNFWATWCGSCIKEIPSFEKLQATYKNRPLKVLLISMDSEQKLTRVVAPFVKANNIHLPVYLAIRKSDEDLINSIDKDWSGALPATLVINSKKQIRKLYEQAFTYDELDKLYLSNN